MHTLLLKPALDNRDPKADHIVSRIGLNAEANLFTPETDLESHIKSAHAAKPLDCVFLDEAQFLTPEQVWALARVSDYAKIPIMCYGLRTDFQGELFPGAATLLAIADDVREIRTLCWCGKKATMTLRIDEAGQAITQGAQVEVGGNERYISLCRRHWAEKKTSR
jgi:thymidine kinase